MNNLAHSFFAFCVLWLPLGCFGNWGNSIKGSGVSKAEVRELGSFTKIQSNGSADISVVIGEKQEVTLEADDNLLPLIDTTVSGDTLTVGSTQNYSTRIGVKLRIVVPSLTGLQINGSGDAKITGVTGSSFDATIQGSGDVVVKGSAEAVKASIRGSGDIDFSQLVAKTASASIAGSGDIKVHCTESLEASVAGSGSIKYAGEPKHVAKSATGVGSITPLK